MREIIIKVPDKFGKTLEEEKVNSGFKGELVRCKDCKHRNEANSPYWEIWCERNDRGVDGDWFCADGERKTAVEEDDGTGI